ncbi:membrane protein insertase YidC [Iocasia frigidifontis]|uniref:Membrane protein insertase YidC n=1 Tax=Iocasia fonsfrigidae TaxID=2682810 RepID=A0A8A7KF23_9FIRM|nr:MULTISPECIES: YidC/Oxa1 family membrane protein insertase [Halanaerobiaceae]AZO93597.1 protein translocase component YidC [Halocella sp. SP3-1]MTI61884.1 membrane protein insertase YidC [Bacillota bacterium]QTL99870.1 membrane protein insertase YidC [Iocasia fonsfrigidae]
MGWLTDIMSEALLFINGLVNNYGLSIIIFTVIIRLLMYPLQAKQTKSMKQMQDLQPKMKEIQEKYKDDKQKQQEELAKLYKENNANPMAGCLPMIVTMIIIFPLYRSIYGLDMDNTTFLWIQNLAQPDIALVILNGLAMFGSTYLTQQFTASSSQNTTMMYIMPLFIIFVGFKLPAGVLIYWFTQTVLLSLQQYIIYNSPDEKEVVKE